MFDTYIGRHFEMESVHSLVSQYLEPLVDNVLRRRSAVVVGQVSHGDALGGERARVVAGLAHAHHHAYVVFAQLLRMQQQGLKS